MELSTKRLRLRELTMDDVEACNVYESDVEVVRYQSHGVRTLDESRAYIARVRSESDVEKRTLYDLAIVECDECDEGGKGEVVGRVGVHVRDVEQREAALWYVVRRDRWGRGYVPEATRALADFAFRELDVHRLYVDVDPRNVASIRIAEKLGMRKEAHFIENLWWKGEWTDTAIYALLQREWR